MSSQILLARLRHSLLLAMVLPLFVLPAQAQQADDEQRVSSTRLTERGGREGQPGDEVQHRFPRLVTGGQRSSTGASKPAGGSDARASEASGVDFWFYSADVILFNDDDGDGYFHGIDLLFDADTYFDRADVYAVLYLSFEGGPWNEYAATDDFTLYGASSDDEYTVVTELQTGYPTGSYDVLIELYDAFDGAFVASFGPEDTSELAFLPLEDYNRDAPYVEEIVVVGHGGGNGFALLPLVMLPLAVRYFRRRRLARVRAPFA